MAVLQPVGSQPELVLGVIPAQCSTSPVSAKLHEVVGFRFLKVCWIEARVPTAHPNLVLSANLQRMPSASCSGFSGSPSTRREDTALVFGLCELDDAIIWHLFLRFHTRRLSGKAGLIRPCCSLGPSCSIPPFPLPGCSDTSVWGRVENQTGGRMWDTRSHLRYFCPSHNFFALKQSFLRQRSCEQSCSAFGSES